jgi:hypothetical protein
VAEDVIEDIVLTAIENRWTSMRVNDVEVVYTGGGDVTETT